MKSAELSYMDLTDVAHALERRELSSLEVTRAMLERIATLDPSLLSYVTVMADSAEREAAAADRDIGKGSYRGTLHGVPLAVKDLCDAAGVATVAGMPRIRAQCIASRDATVVARLRAAGAVILGKLQLTEGAVAHHHPDVPPPVNPHNANYWSGASSSGSGVATAAGLCYGSLGSDTGGSIRFPSFANGVTGVKPTWGRVSRAGVFPLSPSLDHIGPMARSAADCAAILRVIAGSDADDPTALRAPVPDYGAALAQGVKGLRVGFDEAYATTRVAPLIAQAIHDGIAVLKDAGADIVPITFPSTAAIIGAWFPLCTVEAAISHEATYPGRQADFGARLTGLIDGGRQASGIDYAKAHALRLNFRGEVEGLFERVDVMIAPALMRQNLTTAEFAHFGDADSDWPDLVRFTAPFDVSGSPTISLPAGFGVDGAPYGFQLIGGHLNEGALLRAGHAWQQATVWHKRRPQLAP